MTTTFDFAEVAIPERAAGPGRPAEPNPFLGKVADLVEADGTPRDVAVSFTLSDEPESEAANRVKRQLARAGIVHGVSIFKKFEPVAEGSRVTFWAQTRIVPQRRAKVATVEDDQDDSPDSAALGLSDDDAVTDNVTRLTP